MGDQVMGLKSRDPDSNVVSSPPFAYVLGYDHQMRKEMVKLMNEGVEMVAALEKARKDVNVKERYCITPSSMSALTAVYRAGGSDPGRLRGSHGQCGLYPRGRTEDGRARKAKAKERGRARGTRASSSTVIRQTAGRSATAGTVRRSDAGTTAAGCTAVRSETTPTTCVSSTRAPARRRRRRTLQALGVVRGLDRKWLGRRLPLHRSRQPQQGARA